MDRCCHNCYHCRPRTENLGHKPFYDGECILSGAHVNYDDVCAAYVMCEDRCLDCLYCVSEPSSCDPERNDVWCMQFQYACTPGQENIADDTVACCEFRKK